MTRTPDDEIWGCDSCSQREPSERLMRVHIRARHSGNATPLLLREGQP